MTIRAYQETYLSKAQAMLGDAFDYVINTCGIPAQNFIKYFIVSSVSKRVENGEPALIVGKSGIEIAVDVVLETTGRPCTIRSMKQMFPNLQKSSMKKYGSTSKTQI